MTRILLIGSGNLEKAAELKALLRGTSWAVRNLKDFGEVREPLEDADDFEANALLKARYYSSHFDVSCVADDSGLEVDALNGAPGVYSARYAGEDCTYADNNKKLLEAMSEVPEGRRGARFVCCAAYADPAGVEHVYRGTVEGRVGLGGTGENGFGYDPIFIPRGHAQSFGEMTPQEKGRLSHRGVAFRQLRKFLQSIA